jgi:hypothetical protein
MRHPTDGTLRRLVDEPVGVSDADRAHVAGCAACLAEFARVREDAALTSEALDTGVAPDVDAAWQRLSGTIARDGARRAPSSAPARRWRPSLRSPVVAAVGVVALLTGAGAAAAADWLQIFRTEQVAPVAVTQADLVQLPDLTAYGDVEISEEPDLRAVPDAAAAEAATGLDVPEVTDLPQGVTGDPVLQVGDRLTMEFTFSEAEAEQTAAAVGEDLPAPPAGLDGSRFRLSAGPGVAAVWTSGSDLPAMVVARAVAPTAESSGISFDTARDYLLSLPGLPEDVATQLRTFSGDGTTLPIPVPAELVESEPADVDGAPATLLTTRDGTIAGVVWVDEGVVTAVAGTLSTDEVLSVARELR